MDSIQSPEDPAPPTNVEGADENTSHDQIWKTLLTHFVADFFQLISPELAATLDLSELEWLDKESFTDFPQGEKVVADLLGKARTNDGTGRILLLHHEFEGDFRSSIDVRVDRYIMHLRLKYALPVLSAVLFLKGGPKGLEIRGVVDQIGPTEVYRSRYYAFGFTGCLAEDWVERPEPLAAAFAAMMRSKVWDQVEKKIHCLRAITRAPVDEARRVALADVVETYVELKPEEVERYAAELNRESNQEVRDMEMSWSQKLRTEGRREGRREGEREGKREGKLEGVREAIVLLWENKFGSMVEAARRRIDEITDLSHLYEILEQISGARSAEEVSL